AVAVTAPRGRQAESRGLERRDLDRPSPRRPRGRGAAPRGAPPRVAGRGRAVRLAARSGGDVLIEEYVPGAEVTVGILDGRALGALEVVAKGEFHTYDV